MSTPWVLRTTHLTTSPTLKMKPSLVGNDACFQGASLSLCASFPIFQAPAYNFFVSLMFPLHPLFPEREPTTSVDACLSHFCECLTEPASSYSLDGLVNLNCQEALGMGV
ncbi:hypothetical protein Bca101_029290 [Brassica carinata]